MKPRRVISAVLLSIALEYGYGQTTIDLRTQTKNVDFSGALATRPVKTGPTLPAQCSIGQMFFLTAAQAGRNLYGCTATNVWTTLGYTEGGGGGASMASQLGDYAVTRSSATVLAIGAGCSPSAPCNVRFGNTVYTVTAGATATLSSGSGTAYIYFSSNGNLTVGHDFSVSCSSGCAAQSGVTAFPPDSLPLYTWTAINGAWDAAGGTDRRGWLSTRLVSGGAGIIATDTGSGTTVAIDTASVPAYLTAAATLSFTAIAAGTCGADRTFPLPGAAAGDAVAPGWPSGLEAGLAGIMRVSAANTIAVRLCNLSGATMTPASASFRATVIRSF